MTRIVTIIAGLAIIVSAIIGINLYSEHEADRQATQNQQQTEQDAQQAASQCKAQGDDPQSDGTCAKSVAHRDCVERGGKFTPTPNAFSAGTCDTSQAYQQQSQTRQLFDECVSKHGGSGGLDARAAAEDYCNQHGAGG